ncbi:MAG: hypothetical protein ACSHYB_14655 [Roseibacillus sp.]
MRLSTLLPAVAVSLIFEASAATVGFDSGTNFVLFQVASGDPLQNGFLHAGYYATSPIGLGAADLQENFMEWAVLGNDSAASGYFGDPDFPDTVIGAEAGLPIYLMVTDTASIGDATQLAVFTNTSDASWTFPGSDIALSPSISLDDVVLGASGASLLAGLETTSSLTSGGPAIGLVAVPEPSITLLGFVAVFGVVRRRR